MAGWRKTTDVDPEVLETSPEPHPALRNETDPDPLIEEMVGRLRDGLSSLVAVDEWGRPLAWRNVVRLALGPLASRLRDTEQALELAVSMIPPTAEEATVSDAPVEEIAAEAPVVEAAVEEIAEEATVAEAPVEEVEETTVEEATVEEAPVAEAPVAEAAVEEIAEALAAEAPIAERSTEQPAAEAPVVDPDAPAVPSGATVDVILPVAEAVTDVPVSELRGEAILAEEPTEVEVDESPVPPQAAAPVAQPPAVPVVRTSAVTSLFTVSGDQRTVAVRPLSASELLSGGSPDDSTAAKYDRFLTSLYGERKQVRRD